MRRLLIPLVVLLALPAAARADWTAPVRVTPVMDDATALGLSAPGDAPALLIARRLGPRRNVLELRSATRARGPLGAPIRVASSEHSFAGAAVGTSSLGGGQAGDQSAAWLQIIGGVRRPVVATGARLADRQVLTGAGSRSSQILAFAANRLGDAVVAFWRYAGTSSTSYEVLASYRHAGQPFGTPQVVATGTPGFPVAAIGESGSAAVGWSTPQGLAVAEHVGRRAGGFAPAAMIPGSAGANGGLALAEGDDGRAVAAWTVRGTPGGVLLADRVAGATVWSDPITLNTASAPVRASVPPAVAIDRDETQVAWTQAGGGKPSHDVARYLLRRGTVWGDEPATVDPGIRGRTVTTRLLAPALTRPGLLMASAFSTHRFVTATVRPDGTLGPKRTIAWPGSAGALTFPPLAAQGGNSTWVALLLEQPGGGWTVSLSRSR